MDEWPYRRWSIWQQLLRPRNPWAGWFYLLAILNLALHFVTLVPDHIRGHMSDGGQLLDLLWGGRVVISRVLIGILLPNC